MGLEGREWPAFADLADAQTSVADYFDYYNHERLHVSIGYQTPYHTPQQLLYITTLNSPAQMDHLKPPQTATFQLTLPNG